VTGVGIVLDDEALRRKAKLLHPWTARRALANVATATEVAELIAELNREYKVLGKEMKLAKAMAGQTGRQRVKNFRLQQFQINGTLQCIMAGWLPGWLSECLCGDSLPKLVELNKRLQAILPKGNEESM
jgi:hypothetical protein